MRKKTKIVATISDNHCDPKFIQELFDNGMNVVRINTAHATIEGATKIIESVRKVSDRIAILIDTKGPEIRLTDLDKDFMVHYGDIVHFASGAQKQSSRDCLYVSYSKFVEEMPVGTSILVDDGMLEFVVEAKEGNKLRCKAMNEGLVQGKKSINIPSTHLKLPSITQRDIQFINFSVDQNIDFIAHSFVRRKEDVIAVKSILDSRESDIAIISKIENKEGVDNIDEIFDESYGVMVARGDLGIEIPMEQLPVIQKMIIRKGIEKRKPVIVATQMLHSMIRNPRPTRAEVSDIANAIYDGTDAVMLSGETASGKYPLESVKVMTRIAKEIEANYNAFQRDLEPYILSNPVSAQLIRSAVKITESLDVKAIVADTFSGKAIRGLSAYRGRNTIYAQCYDKKVMRQLVLSYGVHVDYLPLEKGNNSQFIKEALNQLEHKKIFNPQNLILVIAGNYGREHGSSYIEVATVENLLKK